MSCYNMDEPWGVNAKQNQPITRGQILYDSMHTKNPKSSKSIIETESRKAVGKGRGVGMENSCLVAKEFSFARAQCYRDLWHNNVNIFSTTELHT